MREEQLANLRSASSSDASKLGELACGNRTCPAFEKTRPSTEALDVASPFCLFAEFIRLSLAEMAEALARAAEFSILARYIAEKFVCSLGNNSSGATSNEFARPIGNQDVRTRNDTEPIYYAIFRSGDG